MVHSLTSHVPFRLYEAFAGAKGWELAVKALLILEYTMVWTQVSGRTKHMHCVLLRRLLVILLCFTLSHYLSDFSVSFIVGSKGRSGETVTRRLSNYV